MPASLRSGAEPSPGHTRSFGHFSRGENPATDVDRRGRRHRDGHRRQVDDRRRRSQQHRQQQPGARRRRPACDPPARGRRSGGRRPARCPRGSPWRASSMASALVEPVSATHRTSAKRAPGPPARADLARPPGTQVTIWPCSPRSSSPTGARSLSASSAPARRWASPRWRCTPSSTGRRCTSASPTRPTRSAGRPPPRATSTPSASSR